MSNPITRRSALKALTLGALAAAVNPARAVDPQGRRRPASPNSAIYGFRIGDNDAFAIQCGAMEVRPEQPFFAVEASSAEFAAALRETTQAGALRMPYNVLLLDWNGEYVLVDTGEPGRDGDLPPLHQQLRALGLAAEQISHVILTHAHFDHLGGLLDDEGRPRFPRARHHVFRAEADFWTAPAPDVSRMRMGATDMIRMARRIFAGIEFHFPAPGTEVVPGIRVFLSPGHTPGHMTLRLTSGESTLYHIADLSHHARLLLEHSSWSIGSDVDPALAVRTRETIFRTLAESRERVFGFHLPFPGLGCLVQSATGFRWIQEDWRPGRG